MATWTEIKGYIFQNYKVHSDDGDLMTLNFETGQGRSQFVVVEYMNLDNPLVRFSSPVGKVGQVTSDRVLEAGASTPFGVVKMDQFYALTHVQLAATVDGDEIDMPLQLVTLFADIVEDRLGLGDHF